MEETLQESQTDETTVMACDWSLACAWVANYEVQLKSLAVVRQGLGSCKK